MLAQISGRHSSEYSNYVLKAYYTVVRLIQQAVENASHVSKEIQKFNLQLEANSQDKAEAKKKAQLDVGSKKPNAADTQKGYSTK